MISLRPARLVRNPELRPRRAHDEDIYETEHGTVIRQLDRGERSGANPERRATRSGSDERHTATEEGGRRRGTEWQCCGQGSRWQTRGRYRRKANRCSRISYDRRPEIAG